MRYALFLDLTGQKVVVIGAGKVATRKIRTLLAAGAKVNARDRHGETPLHKLVFCIERTAKIVGDILLANGADVLAKSNGGLTPFALAKDRRNPEMMEYFASRKGAP